MADAAPAADDPKVGEVRTYGGETRRWDGMAWRLVPRTFLGGEDFTGRMREYAKPLATTAAKDLISPVLHPLDTLSGLASGISRTASGAAHAVMHPTQPVEDMGILSDLGRMLHGAAQGDPEAAGHLTAIAAGPKVYDAGLNAVNAGAHAVAETPAVRSGLGYLGGAGAALVTGAGHPFIGGIMGRVASPLLQRPAAEVANATDWLKSKIHGTGPAGLTPELQRDYAAVQKAMGTDAANTWLQRELKNPRQQAPPAPTGSSAPITSDGTAANPLTGETPEQWTQRVQAKINQLRAQQGPTGPGGLTEADILKRNADIAAREAANKANSPAARGEPPPPQKPLTKTAKLADSPPNPAADEIVDRMAGGPDQPSKGNGTSTTTLAEDIERLRRKHGADRIGRTINPNAPEVGTGSVLNTAPGPSAMPDVAQKALLDHLQNPSQISDPSRTLRALSQLLKEYKRNAGTAKSPVAQELATLLKKHGFDVP